MKQAILERYGKPEDGVRCADTPDVGAPAAGEVVFDVLAFPINPADISMCRGELLPHRGDRDGLGPRAARRAHGQDPGRPERAALSGHAHSSFSSARGSMSIIVERQLSKGIGQRLDERG
jgi:hypothetical protein